jgi:hypothetical protein
MKNCPYCAEQIQETAVKCRYCGEWLTSEKAGMSAESTASLTPPGNSTAIPEHIIPQAEASTAKRREPDPKLKGFGGWLMVFLLLQFVPLMQFIGRYGEQALLEHLFVAGWLVLGIVLAFTLLYEGHPAPVRLIELYLIVNLALGAIGIWYASQSNAVSVGTIIGASLPSFIWLLYFIISKRVRATYLIKSFAVSTGDIGITRGQETPAEHRLSFEKPEPHSHSSKKVILICGAIAATAVAVGLLLTWGLRARATQDRSDLRTRAESMSHDVGATADKFTSSLNGLRKLGLASTKSTPNVE